MRNQRKKKDTQQTNKMVDLNLTDSNRDRINAPVKRQRLSKEKQQRQQHPVISTREAL